MRFGAPSSADSHGCTVCTGQVFFLITWCVCALYVCAWARVPTVPLVRYADNSPVRYARFFFFAFCHKIMRCGNTLYRRHRHRRSILVDWRLRMGFAVCKRWSISALLWVGNTRRCYQSDTLCHLALVEI